MGRNISVNMLVVIMEDGLPEYSAGKIEINTVKSQLKMGDISGGRIPGC
jgi:hypothetical protein